MSELDESPGAHVVPVYSNGQRKAGRAARVHHWEAWCNVCNRDVRPTGEWTSKKETQRIANMHTAAYHG